MRKKYFSSHQGIEGNENADFLAKEATTDRTNEANISIPHQVLLASATKEKNGTEFGLRQVEPKYTI